MRQLVITFSILLGMTFAGAASAHYDRYDYYYFGPLGYYGPCYDYRLPEPGFSFGRYNERWRDRSCYQYWLAQRRLRHIVRAK